jgi:F-type H+-transporting ATPase subunit alpha
MPVEEQVLVIYAVTEGFLDDIDVDHVRRFENGLREHVRTRYAAVLEGIRETGAIADDDAMREAISTFAERFDNE